MVNESSMGQEIDQELVRTQQGTLEELTEGWGHVTSSRGTFIVNPENLLQSAMYAFARAKRDEFAQETFGVKFASPEYGSFAHYK